MGAACESGRLDSINSDTVCKIRYLLLHKDSQVPTLHNVLCVPCASARTFNCVDLRRAPAGETCGLVFEEREGLVAMQLDAVRPVPGRQPGLVHQLPDKLFRRTNLFPNLGQEGSA